MKSVKCPKCGCPMKLLNTLLSMPPIHKFICPKCGEVIEIKEENENGME